MIGTLTYTGARAGAICRLRLQDLRDYGDRRTFLFDEKGGRRREIPVRLDLDGWITRYVTSGVLQQAPPESPLFRAAESDGHGRLTDRPLQPWALRAMLKRRLRAAGLPPILTPHSFRVMVITDLLTQRVPMEDVQFLAGHAHPSTTQLYDRRAHTVSRNIVERISV